MNLPRVTIVAPLRQSEDYINGFLGQLDDLDYPTEALRVVLVEGDSTDNTYLLTAAWAAGNNSVKLIKYDTGREKYASTLDAKRLAHLAEIFNKCFEAVDLEWSDYVMFSPSDVLFNNQLVSRLVSRECDLIAPMYWQDQEDRFYDIWGFAEEGEKWGPKPQAWYAEHKPGPLIKMKTVGGCVLLKAELIEAGARYSPVDCDHGLCRSVQDLGGEVYADTTTNIYHR